MDIALSHLCVALAAINLFTWAAFWLDKNAAKQGQWRIPEQTLLVLSLAGGSVAAYFAMQRFRHKTKKSSFRVKFWGVVGLQLMAVIYGIFLAETPVRIVVA